MATNTHDHIDRNDNILMTIVGILVLAALAFAAYVAYYRTNAYTGGNDTTNAAVYSWKNSTYGQ